MKITILGSGAWGITLGELALINKHQVQMWSRSQESDLGEMVKDSSIIIVALAMAGVSTIAQKLHRIGLNDSTILVSGTKGLEPGTGRTPSQIWQQVFPQLPIVVLSGPNLSQEIRLGLPAAAVVASINSAAAHTVQAALASRNFRLYTNPDPLGVELGGTLKNVIAIAVGVCDGLNLGSNAKAALITRSLREIIRIGIGYGAQPETFWGLAGLGDLLATCNSNLSRNYQVGYGLSQGKSLPEILAHIKGTAEGVHTAAVLAQRSGADISMPVCRAVDRLLQGELSPQRALEELLDRDLRPEL